MAKKIAAVEFKNVSKNEAGILVLKALLSGSKSRPELKRKLADKYEDHADWTGLTHGLEEAGLINGTKDGAAWTYEITAKGRNAAKAGEIHVFDRKAAEAEDKPAPKKAKGKKAEGKAKANKPAKENGKKAVKCGS